MTEGGNNSDIMTVQDNDSNKRKVTEGKDDVDSVLKGCVRAEKIDAPTYYIEHIIARSTILIYLVKNQEHLKKFYGVYEW